MTQAIASAVVHDLIGIGFGPSNLALAIALEERGQVQGPLDVLFLDKQADYRWHGNTLVTQSELQISFLKDLVTLRNPTSPYSFVNYLKAHGRLVDFINLGTFYPCRMEFNDYLRWVASHFEAQSRYGEEVLAIEPVLHQQQVEALRVISRDAHGQQHWCAPRARWWSAPAVRRAFPRRSRRSRTTAACSTTPSTWRAWPQQPCVERPAHAHRNHRRRPERRRGLH
jgi:lysine/ornithine N-monooxygenase